MSQLSLVGPSQIVLEAAETLLTSAVDSNGYHYKVQMLPENLLVLGASYQRPIHQGRVKMIIHEFDEKALGVIEVALRKDGQFWIIDGQSRVTAMRRMQPGAPMLCKAHYNATPEDEARIFAGLNGDRSAVQALTVFNARREYDDPMAREIISAANEYGIEIPKSRKNADKPNETSAVSTLQEIYRNHGSERIRVLMQFSRDVWDGDRRSLGKSVLYGLNGFLEEFGPIISQKRLMVKLQAVPMESLIARCIKMKKDFRCSQRIGAKYAMIYYYNGGLQANKRLAPKILPSRDD